MKTAPIPKSEHNIFEVLEYFEHETKKLKKELSKKVIAGKISKVSAREKYDMYLNMLSYLFCLKKSAEHEDWLGDKEVSQHVIYSKL